MSLFEFWLFPKRKISRNGHNIILIQKNITKKTFFSQILGPKTFIKQSKLFFCPSAFTKQNWSGAVLTGQNIPAATNSNFPSYAPKTILPNCARVYRQTDRQCDYSIHPNFVANILLDKACGTKNFTKTQCFCYFYSTFWLPMEETCEV